jgi:hypothetical protein
MAKLPLSAVGYRQSTDLTPSETVVGASKPGKVYFIVHGGTGLVKIGWTGRDPRTRLSGLQIGSPWPLSLVRVMAGTKQDEKGLHAKYTALRVRGEWFKWAAPLSAFIEALPPMPSRPVSIEDAAYSLIVSRGFIEKAIEAGRLVRHGKMITRESLEAFARECRFSLRRRLMDDGMTR